MTNLGRTIRIYLPAGSSTGIKHGEIVNWSGQGIVCPRARFADLQSWPEVRRAGVYCLFGHDDDTGVPIVYVGEAENLIERLASHATSKEFWNELIAFSSKDENLTKGHARYLESRLISRIEEANRYILDNSTRPKVPSLPRPDRDAMEEYIENVSVLLGVFGHRALESIQRRPADSKKDGSDSGQPRDTQQIELMISTNSVQAKALRVDEGILVLAGSEAANVEHTSLSRAASQLRGRLIDSGVLVQGGGNLNFTKDFLFSSASKSAVVITGYSINGRTAWKSANGETLKEIEEHESELLFKELFGSKDKQPA